MKARCEGRERTGRKCRNPPRGIYTFRDGHRHVLCGRHQEIAHAQEIAELAQAVIL